MQKKILLFAHDPGGANTIIPLIDLLKKKYEIVLFGKNMALKRYQEFGYSGKNIAAVISDFTQQAVTDFLSEEMPDVVVTGTSATDKTEKYLWRSCEKLTIPSCAILDQWMNYGVRFSAYSIDQIEAYLGHKTHAYVPSKICVMDDYAREQTLAEGIAGSRVIVTGQPYFDLVQERKKTLSHDHIVALRKSLYGEVDILITFASEPLSLVYKDTDYLGYTEQIILQQILDVLTVLAQCTQKKIVLVIRPHPKEDLLYYHNLVVLPNTPFLRVVVDNAVPGAQAMLMSDVVCGMSSMFLLEAALLNIPILSVQIGLKTEDPFILSRRNFIKTILDKTELFATLQAVVMYQRAMSVTGFLVIQQAAKNVARVIDSLLWGEMRDE
ncbi:hypothetical protein K2W90_05175 [Candidatus Babeliales bacterium]|nr:hypothetical protein [Candidatus Babeliales bacterium]